mmetsp:Transcript_39534/g.104756  ORF Transcript_39534/g.104756 Transcript_39534/m.104756 type:complete len:233 (-) Transcript_39534:703-1401(-)
MVRHALQLHRIGTLICQLQLSSSTAALTHEHHYAIGTRAQRALDEKVAELLVDLGEHPVGEPCAHIEQVRRQAARCASEDPSGPPGTVRNQLQHGILRRSPAFQEPPERHGHEVHGTTPQGLEESTLVILPKRRPRMPERLHHHCRYQNDGLNPTGKEHHHRNVVPCADVAHLLHEARWIHNEERNGHESMGHDVVLRNVLRFTDLQHACVREPEHRTQPEHWNPLALVPND